MVSAPTYEQIQPQIIELIKDKIIIGHTLFNDLAVRPPLTLPHLHLESPPPGRTKSKSIVFIFTGDRASTSIRDDA